MAERWLKAVGMGESKAPVADDWRTHGLLARDVFFSRRPAIRDGLNGMAEHEGNSGYCA